MSAIMFPKEEKYLSEKLPYSEREVYRALSTLPKDYVIFHSVRWVNKNNYKPFTWYENDFVILHKKYGILVLEVKGGLISFGGGLVMQTNTETNETKILDEGNDPLTQAANGKYHYRKLLDAHIKGISKRISIEPCIWFPSCKIKDDAELPLLYKEARKAILDGEDISNVKDAMANVNLFYNSEEKTDISDEEFNQIIEILAPEFDLIPSPSIIKGELEHAFLKLTAEQSGLLDYISEQRVATIQGAAGTGKTLIALEAAKRFSNDGKKVLFLCFNRFLFEHLKFDCPINNVDFFNIHTFVKEKTQTALDLTADATRAKELQKIDFDKLGYGAVIIDEAQDFTDQEIEYFAVCTEVSEIPFFVFFDKNQLVTTDKVPDWITKSECKLVLSKNCRNTYEIACTSYNVIDVPIKTNTNMINGVQPTMTFAPSKSLISIGHLIKYFKDDDNGYKDSEITILSMKPENESIMNGMNKIDGILISRERNNKSVFYTTAKKFKGLESKVIIITDIDESCFSDEKQKRAFYVACSRARHRLALFIDGNDEKIKNIANAAAKGMFSAKGKILMKTKTVIFDDDI